MDSGVTKQDLLDMEARLAAHLAKQLQASEDRTAALIAAEIGSLHADMGARFARVDVRLESIDTRLKLQAGLIQSGARAMARFSEFAETSEERWVALVGRLEALEPKPERGGDDPK